MGSIKRLHVILSTVYIGIALLFMIDVLTNFEIRNQSLKSFVYYGALFATPFILILNFILSKENRFLALLSPLLMLTLIFTIGFGKILSNVNAWQTQVILYKNEKSKLTTIEQQIQENEALKFNTRVVKVTHLGGLFMIVYQTPNDIATNSEWIKVNQYVKSY